jgi:hypothetical protein
MCEKGVEHVSADSRTSLVRDLIEMQKIRKFFREQERVLYDAFFDPYKMLACTPQIGLGWRSQQRGAISHTGEHKIELNSITTRYSHAACR